MSLSRRDLLKIGVVGGTACALPLGAVAEAHTPVVPPNAVGMLYDSTRCIGCKSCVVACAEANGLEPDTTLDSIHQAPNDLNAHTKNIIKLYKGTGKDANEYAFVKRQCMHWRFTKAYSLASLPVPLYSLMMFLVCAFRSLGAW